MPPQDPVSAALAHPDTVTNWWPIVVLGLVWSFREILPLLLKVRENAPPTKKDVASLIENQTALLEEQQQALDKISSILDLCTEKVLNMATDVAILKDRTNLKERD